MYVGYQFNYAKEFKNIFNGNFENKKSFHSFAPAFEYLSLELKAYIIEESDKLFCQYGFKSVTMDDIAKQLGMSKKTIYQHFKDKNELVNILITNKINNQSCKIAHQRQAENAIQEIFFAIEDSRSTLSQMSPKLFFDLQKYHPEAWLKFKAFKDKSISKSVLDNLERGIAEGYYRHDIKKEVIVAMRLNQLDMLFTQKTDFLVDNYSMAEVMAEITEHFLYGICNSKGLAYIYLHKEKTNKQS